jgi:hypothetical protein
MTVAIKDLMSDDQYLVDVTDAELREMNGGYAARIVRDTFNPALASFTTGLVINQRVSENLSQVQRNIGIPPATVQFGVDLANNDGGGVYTVPVTAQKLGG